MFLFGLILFANKSFCASHPFVDEFNGHLDSLRVYATASAMASLRMGEEDEKLSSLSVTHESKIEPIAKSSAEAPDRIEENLWHVQRGIEKLLEENHPFETFKAVVHSLKRFGDEIENPGFWAMAGQVYLETEIDLRVKGYEGENHWQTWFRIHFSGAEVFLSPRKEDVLGCLLYPVRHTTMHCMDVWKYNPFVFYLQAHSANYGNVYAIMRAQEFIQRRKSTDKEAGIHMRGIDSILLKDPFSVWFNKNANDVSRLLWIRYAGNYLKHGSLYLTREEMPESLKKEATILEEIKNPTAEVEYYLGLKLLDAGDEDKAEVFLKRAMERGFIDAHEILSARLSKKGYGPFARKEFSFEELDIEKIVMDTYREVLNIEM